MTNNKIIDLSKRFDLSSKFGGDWSIMFLWIFFYCFWELEIIWWRIVGRKLREDCFLLLSWPLESVFSNATLADISRETALIHRDISPIWIDMIMSVQGIMLILLGWIDGGKTRWFICLIHNLLNRILIKYTIICSMDLIKKFWLLCWRVFAIEF